MASETLSQTDVDRLLSSAAHVSPLSVAAKDLPLYDFNRPARVSKERLRTLEAMYERLVKGLEGWLISRVRGQMEVRLRSVEEHSFGEFRRSLPRPCSSYIFEIVGTGQRGVIDIGPELSTYLIERLFGGEGSGKTLTRILTPIERIAVRSVADRVAELLQEIWLDHVPLDLTISGYESSPEILQVVNREDPVLVANVEFSTGDLSSLLVICLPFSVLDQFFTSHDQQRSGVLTTSELERKTTRQRSEATLRITKVPLTARLPDFHLSLRDIAGITVGSILPTGIATDARIILRAGTQERFTGLPGRVNGHLAVRILDAVSSAPNATTPDSRTT